MLILLLNLSACMPSFTPGVLPPAPTDTGGWYPDRDGDGYGDPDGALAALSAWGWVDNALDCDDADADVHPGAAETWANGYTDNDCDGRQGAVNAAYTGAVWRGESAGDEAGRAVAAAGDLDGDGHGEVMVAAPYAGADGEDAGAVYLLRLGPSSTLSTLARLDSVAGSWLGASLDGGQDLTGDGVPDVLVGAPGWGGDQSGGCALISGAAWAKAGSLSLPEDAVGTLPGGSPGSYGGSACVFAGDVDGDGISEIAVSAPWAIASPDLQDAGMVALYSGAAVAAGEALTRDDALLTWWGGARGTRLGTVLAPMGDLDGDGAADLLISAWRNPVARVVSGRTGAQIAGVAGDARGRPRMVGDVDGDGHPDLALIGPDLYLHTHLASRPDQRPESAALSLKADTGFLDAVDLGDRDGDGAAELLLTAPYGQGGEDGWIGVLGSGLPARLITSASALRLQGFSDAGDSYGYRAARIPDLYGPGLDGIVLASFDDSAAGDHAGAVLALVEPR